MLKKMPLRLRLTIISVGLLTLCCLGLTLVLNLSANRMADVIEATPILPADSIYETLSPPEPAGMTIAPSETSQTARKDFLSQSFLWLLAIVAAGGVLTYWITGIAMDPLNELSAQMKNQTVHNLSENLPVPKSRDEVASLTVSFNEMTDTLGEAFAMQRRFSQSAAHELRTPLTVLKTKLSVFRKKPDRTLEEYNLLLDLFATQTDRLSGLVEALLELTNMDALEYTDHIPLQELLSDITAELSVLAKEKQVVISLSCPELTTQGSESLLHRAFYNLVENAIKYNTPGGTVKIHGKKRDGRTVISISDTGIGISCDHQSLIFEPFYRIDKSRSREMGGAGLGLSTVKTILDKHNAKLTVSQRPGGGSIFTVIL